jgi:L-rhamnonate dehydratase
VELDRLNRRQLFLGAAGVAIALSSSRPSSAAANAFRHETIKRVQAAHIDAGVVVVVETASGVVGHGFTAITNSPVVVSVVRDVIARAIIGKDALAREAIYEQLQQTLVLRGLMAGHAMHAISAVDIALWDIAGKVHAQPVCRLLGGARPVIPAYTTFGQATLNREQLVASAKEHVASGQRRLKMVVAAGSLERIQKGESMEDILTEDVERIRLVREAIGPDVALFIDANHGLNEYEARRFIERIEPFGLALFEEPLRGNDIRRLADLRRHSPIPISAGQNEGHIARWRDMAIHDAVDILQLNVCMCGGYTGALKIAGVAAAFSLPIDNGGGYALFNMHLHGGLANGGMVEWHMSSVALERSFYIERFELDKGRLVLPERPGLGFELKPEILKRMSG